MHLKAQRNYQCLRVFRVRDRAHRPDNKMGVGVFGLTPPPYQETEIQTYNFPF